VNASGPRPHTSEVARVAAEAAELLEVLWGRASTAPVSVSQLRVLFILEHNDGINLRTLADALGASPPSTSRLCDRLEAVGFVERAASTVSRRELHLRLTGRGASFLRDLRVRREQELEVVLARMPGSRRTALLQGLEAFCAAASSRIGSDEEDARLA